MNWRRGTAGAWAMVMLIAACATTAAPAPLSAAAAGRELRRAGDALRTALKDTDVPLEKVDGELVMRVPAAALFDADRSSLRSGTAQFRPLADLARVLRRYKHVSAEVRVYTDVIGGTSANQALADARAQAITEALEAIGVTAAQLTAHGLGATQPVAPNDSPEGRRANRRVEIVLSAAGRP